MTIDRMIVLDFETTGLNPGYRPIEVAWIEFDDRLNEVEAVTSLIDPGIPIEPGAQQTHGISEAMVAGMPTLREFIADVHGDKFAGEHVLVAAHNARFDIPMFSAFCDQVTPLCSMRLGHSLYPFLSSHTLASMASHLRIDTLPTHRAADDARTCLEVLTEIARGHSLTIDGLIRASNDFSLESVMPFGKHKGVKLCDLPSDYANWLTQNLDSDNWVREVLSNQEGA
jgi:exodeoxyribonuclease X